MAWLIILTCRVVEMNYGLCIMKWDSKNMILMYDIPSVGVNTLGRIWIAGRMIEFNGVVYVGI